jgi:DNA helicase II / ATP-dependent DNA helicase PcrA
MIPVQAAKSLLLENLTNSQKKAVASKSVRQLIIAGAGSGKTEVMARRVAWWVAVEGVPKDSIVAFTFTERAAEEMKFRIRRHVQKLTTPGEDATLGGMYIGTIHGFCLKLLRESWPDNYHNYDVIDEAGRLALVQRGFHGILGLSQLRTVFGKGLFETIERFLLAYDLLNEYDELDVTLSDAPMPHDVSSEAAWCKDATLRTKVGKTDEAQAFALSASRYYAYLRCRRFLDFSTSQAELMRMLRQDRSALETIRQRLTHIVVDEVQDINPVQDRLIRQIVGSSGKLTAVGDHRQAIFAWRGARVDIMAEFFEELKSRNDSEIVELAENFRSTPRVIGVANQWARTIGKLRTMSSPDMLHGRKERNDFHSSHVAVAGFKKRDEEAKWIATQINKLVLSTGQGATHDTEIAKRGLAYSDVCVLIRSATDARAYMMALEEQGIPAVVKAGPDLFAQPEVLLMLAAIGNAAGVDQFVGAPYNPRSLPNRISAVLGCAPDPESVIGASCQKLRSAGLVLDKTTEERLVLATRLLRLRIEGKGSANRAQLRKLQTPQLIEELQKTNPVRRVFPQTLYHLLLAEARIAEWDVLKGRGATAMFHLGALSTLIKGMETPGWTSPSDFKYQIIGLCLWGAENARTEEAPLLVPPDAVTITTIHSAKGLEYAAVFLADVCARRFPSQFAKRAVRLPFEGSTSSASIRSAWQTTQITTANGG